MREINVSLFCLCKDYWSNLGVPLQHAAEHTMRQTVNNRENSVSAHHEENSFASISAMNSDIELDERRSRMRIAKMREQARLKQAEQERELEIIRSQLIITLENTRAAQQTNSQTSVGNTPIEISTIKVPPFQEGGYLKCYFVMFETMATQQQCPREKWVLQLYPQMNSKPQNALVDLEPEERTDYDKVKAALISCYSLKPDDYHDLFKDVPFRVGDRFSSYIKNTERAFYNWIDSLKASNDYKKTCEAIIIDQILSRCQPSFRRWLKSSRATSSLGSLKEWGDSPRP